MTARVLVVDDLRPNVKLLEAKLTSEYFDVITASDGMTGLEMAKHDQPDIILLDVMMPGMDGFEATETIRGLGDAGQAIPIVALTANAMRGDERRCLAAGMDDYLAKPISPEKLGAMIERWLPGAQTDTDVA
jgi:two-component system cell cycle response regulator